MKLLRRSLVGYVAPPCYADFTPSPPQPFGHVPFDIDIIRLGGSYQAVNFIGDPASASVQLWVDGSAVGTALALARGDARAMVVDPAVTVPGVTAGNIDGASRFGIVPSSTILDGLSATIGFEPVNDADVGKDIYGLGASLLCSGTLSAHYPFAPPTFAFGHPGGWSSSFGGIMSSIFNTEFERNDAGRVPGDVKTVAGFPWVTAGTFSDFLLVLRTAPTASTTFAFRVNQADVITIAVTAGSQRVWSPTGDTTVGVLPGAEVNWRCAAGEDLDGELLWAFRRGPVVGGVLGGGESGGEY